MMDRSAILCMPASSTMAGSPLTASTALWSWWPWDTVTDVRAHVREAQADLPVGIGHDGLAAENAKAGMSKPLYLHCQFPPLFVEWICLCKTTCLAAAGSIESVLPSAEALGVQRAHLLQEAFGRRAPRAAGLRPGPGKGGRAWARPLPRGKPVREDLVQERVLRGPAPAGRAGAASPHPSPGGCAPARRPQASQTCSPPRPLRQSPGPPPALRRRGGSGRGHRAAAARRGTRPSPPPAGGRGARVPPSRGVVERTLTRFSPTYWFCTCMWYSSSTAPPPRPWRTSRAWAGLPCPAGQRAWSRC